MGLLNTTKDLVSLWAKTKKRELQARGQPDTRVDSGGYQSEYTFDGQNIGRNQLREIKDIRESGGVVSHLVHAKALMQFGTGVEWSSDNEELVEWLEEHFGNLDSLLIDLGEDAIWYPYSLAEIVETRAGGFSHVEPVEPWTTIPRTNEFGEVIAWEQEVRANGTRHKETFEPDEIANFILNKSCARDNTGVSEVMRSEEEIRQFRNNRQAVNKAIEIAGFPHHVWKVGQEGGSVIDDNELRRVRNMVESMEGDTQFVVGRDVDHEMIESSEFGFESIQEHDLRELALALGLPLELANVGSDGLGSGMPAELRLQLFERQARASQRDFANQFVEQVVRPVLEKYAPFPRDADVTLKFGDPISDRNETAEFVDRAGPYMTVNEAREEFGLPPEEDEEIGGSYRKPANIEAPEQEQPEDSGGIGGLFSDLTLSEPELESTPEWDAHFLRMHERIWSEDKGKELLETADYATPEFVKERLKDAIRGGAVFSEFENIPSSKLMQLREFLTEELEDDRWNIDGIANRLQDLDADLSFDEAQVIARTETAATVNKAREIGYEERGEEDAKFYWTGSLDDRTTEACEWLINETNPNHGGNPVGLEELKDLIEEAPSHDPDMQDDLARPDDYVVHPQERKTYVRAPGT